jgi:hypothetical protein
MWMVRPHPIATGWLCAAAYMLVKLVLLPALMVGCCFAVGLRGATARAAVLVATLPISGAAFVLSKTYGVGEDVAGASLTVFASAARSFGLLRASPGDCRARHVNPARSLLSAATNVFLGNLLVLPTTISWLEFMDAVNLFPSSKPTTAPMAACV